MYVQTETGNLEMQKRNTCNVILNTQTGHKLEARFNKLIPHHNKINIIGNIDMKTTSLSVTNTYFKK